MALFRKYRTSSHGEAGISRSRKGGELWRRAIQSEVNNIAFAGTNNTVYETPAAPPQTPLHVFLKEDKGRSSGSGIDLRQ